MFLTEWIRLSDSVPLHIVPVIERYFAIVDGETGMTLDEMTYTSSIAEHMMKDVFCDACNIRTLTISTCLMSHSEIHDYINALVPEDLPLMIKHYDVMNDAMAVVTEECDYIGNRRLAMDTEYFGIVYNSCVLLPASYIGVLSVCSDSCVYGDIYRKTIQRIETGDRRCLLMVFVTWLLYNNYLEFTNPMGPESISHMPIVNQIVNFIQYRKGGMPSVALYENRRCDENEFHRLYTKYINVTMQTLPVTIARTRKRGRRRGSRRRPSEQQSQNSPGS